MKTEDKLVCIEKAKKGDKTKVSAMDVFVHDLYEKNLAQIVRLDCEVEALDKRLEKVEAKK